MKSLCALLAAAALVGCSSERMVASPAPRPAAAERVAIRASNPLYIVDGKLITRAQSDTLGLPAEVQQLKPEDVAQIEVIKGDAARLRYGTAGDGGVVVITTKRRD